VLTTSDPMWTQCILWIQASKIRSIFGVWNRLQKSNHRSYWEISSLKNIKGHKRAMIPLA
jgi:hypothetical protein